MRKIRMSEIRIPLSRLDTILLTALGLIGSGVYQLLGSGEAMLAVGILLLLLGMIMARGATE